MTTYPDLPPGLTPAEQFLVEAEKESMSAGLKGARFKLRDRRSLVVYAAEMGFQYFVGEQDCPRNVALALIEMSIGARR